MAEPNDRKKKNRLSSSNFLSTMIKKKNKRSGTLDENTEVDTKPKRLSRSTSIDVEEFEREFEMILDEMNIPDDKKVDIRNKPFNTKVTMWSDFKKIQREGAAGENSPHHFLEVLSKSELCGTNLCIVLRALAVNLRMQPLSWIQEFGVLGLEKVLDKLKLYKLNRSPEEQKIQHDCVKCIKAFMNTKFGLQLMLKDTDGLTVLAHTINAQTLMNKEGEAMMQDVVKIMAAITLWDHEKALEAVTTVTEADTNRSKRFYCIVSALRDEHVSPSLKVACLQFINALISMPSDLNFRLHLRNEVICEGLSEDMLLRLSNLDQKELNIQLKVFEDSQNDDKDEFLQRFSSTQDHMKDTRHLFDIIYTAAVDTECEPYLLSILQHFLMIRDEQFSKPEYYHLIEQCISQIVLQRGGVDPDFDAKKLDINVESIMNSMRESQQCKGLQEAEEKVTVYETKLQKEVTARTEAEVKLKMKEENIKFLEEEVKKVKILEEEIKKLKEEHSLALAATTTAVRTASSTPLPSTPVPPAEELIKPSPTGPLFSTNEAAKPPAAASLPPVPPGFGVPMSLASPRLAPPPPPPPPPPPGMGGPPGRSPSLKQLNWNKIQDVKIKKGTFWASAADDKYERDDYLNDIKKSFAAKESKEKTQLRTEGDGSGAKRGAEPRILDAKCVENISIFIENVTKFVKTFKDFKKKFLEMDEEVITTEVLDGLKNIPNKAVLQKFHEIQEYSDLVSAEQFVAVMHDIPCLQERIECMKIKLDFDWESQKIKDNIATVTEAIKEIRTSKKWKSLLELILLTGNFMNAGNNRIEKAHGFNLEILLKLKDTKSTDGKNTLGHLIAEWVTDTFTDINGWTKELINVKEAQKVCTDPNATSAARLGNQVRKCRKELEKKDQKKPLNDYDKFKEKMEKFVADGTECVNITRAMQKNMSTSFTELLDFYIIDHEKTPAELFKVINQFIIDYEQFEKDNLKRKEDEDMRDRAYTTLEKKRKKEAEQPAGQYFDLESVGDEGIIDNMMETLASGDAFHDKSRKSCRIYRNQNNV